MPGMVEAGVRVPLDLVRAAMDRGAELALVVDDWEVTYAELFELATRMGWALIGAGFRPGSAVVGVCTPSAHSLAIDLAVTAAGMVWVPLNTRLTELEYADQLARIRPAMVVYDPILGATDVGLRLRRAAELLGETIVSPIWCSTESDGNQFTTRKLLDAGGLHVEALPPIVPQCVDRIQFTSGTSARPKAVALTTGAFIRNASAMAKAMKLTQEDRFFSPLPMNHAAGYCTMLTMFLAGGTLVTQRRFAAPPAIELIRKHSCTALRGLDAIFLDLIGQLRPGESLPLRTGVVSTINDEVRRRLTKAFGLPEAVNIYGMTETSGPAAISHWHEETSLRLGTHGSAIDGMSLCIQELSKDSEGRPQGEILMRGSQMMLGYYGDLETTASACVGGWFHSGDLGIYEHGRITYRGRLREIIRVGGENVACAEVDAELLQHPEVLEAAVFPAPDARLEEVVAAAIVRRPGSSLDSTELSGFVEPRLASFKRPRQIYFLDQLPKTESGKIRRQELKKILLGDDRT